MKTIIIKSLFWHPDGTLVIEPDDLAVKCFAVSAEELAGRKPVPGDEWPVPEQQ